MIETVVLAFADDPAARWNRIGTGVTPSMQGRGYGSALLHHALTRHDRERLPAYHESSNEPNIPLYQRHGFEVLGVVCAGSCPPITPMIGYPRREAV